MPEWNGKELFEFKWGKNDDEFGIHLIQFTPKCDVLFALLVLSLKEIQRGQINRCAQFVHTHIQLQKKTHGYIDMMMTMVK